MSACAPRPAGHERPHAPQRHVSELSDQDLYELLLDFLRAFDGGLSPAEIEALRRRCEGIVFLTDAEVGELRQRCEGVAFRAVADHDSQAAELDPVIRQIRDDMLRYRASQTQVRPIAEVQARG